MAGTLITEHADSRGLSLRVDREKGIIRGVKILGLESKNGRDYSPACLVGAVSLYEGAKVNLNHPKGSPASPRDYQDRMGSMKGVTAKADGLYGDFHYNPKHALAEQLAWDAEHAPENVGFSHNVEAKSTAANGRVLVEAITRVQSVDLVADPATTRSIFESEGNMDPALATSVDPVEAVIGAIVDQIVSIAKGDGDSKAKGKQISDLLKKQDKIKAMLSDEKPADKTPEMEALRLSVNSLREQIDGYRTKEAIAAKRAKVEAKIVEAKLPKEAVSEIFTEQCMGAADDGALTKIIEDRQSLAALSGGTPYTPATSKEQFHEGGNSGAEAGRKQGEDYRDQKLRQRGLIK